LLLKDETKRSGIPKNLFEDFLASYNIKKKKNKRKKEKLNI